MKFTIPVVPRTKKNSQQLVKAGGRYIPIPSKQYKEFEKQCALFMPRMKKPIDQPVNVKCVYYMPTRRAVDLVNLIEATNDILVKYGVLADDNRNVVYAQDGSRVFWDKERPRTEVEITPIEGEEVERWKE